MNIEKTNIERLRLKQKSCKNVLQGYSHPLLINHSKIYDVCELSTVCL